MRDTVFQVARYRLRSNVRRRWSSYLALALLVAVAGGTAMTSLAAARRTQSSYPSYLASTNPSTLIASLSAGNGLADADAEVMQRAMAAMPGVQHVSRYASLNGALVGPDGQPELDHLGQVDSYGSVDGLLFDQDRLTVLEGRLPDPRRPDEMVATPAAASLLGLHLDQSAAWEFATNGQLAAPDFDPTNVTPALQLDVKVVGLVLFHDALVQDDVDRLPTAVVFTPALTASLPHDWAVGRSSFTYYGVQLSRRASVAQVEEAIAALTPPEANFDFHRTSTVTEKVERAVKPETIALAVFGAIAAAATLLIGGQVIGRIIRDAEVEHGVLRAVGVSAWGTALDGLVPLVAAIVLGTLLAGILAVALSPLAPIGPARDVYPHRGVDADWTVLGIGAALLVVGLVSIALVMAIRQAPHRMARRRSPSARPSPVVRATTSVGMPLSATIGTQLALEQGRGATAVPVRSALLGSILTVSVVVATITFGASLRTLVSHPALYGWNWEYAIEGEPWVPQHARDMVANDPDVESAAAVNLVSMVIDHQLVPVLLSQPGAQPAPPVLSGRGLEADDEIVVGVSTLAQLHKHVGDTVDVALGSTADVAPKPYRVVGTATLPAIDQPIAAQSHPSMGVGAVLPFSALPPSTLELIQTGPDPALSGPGMLLVRLRDGVAPDAGLAELQRIVDATNQRVDALPNGVGRGSEIVVQSVQHPAEIVNYRNLGDTPAALDLGLAVSVVVALGLTLASSVRRRRRDLALMKSFGFSRRQLAATVAWQASVAAVIGAVVGIPLGIAAGRWLWTLFARSIYVVPQPAVPATPIILVAVGALALANVVAIVPGRVAARTPTAVLLRTD